MLQSILVLSQKVVFFHEVSVLGLKLGDLAEKFVFRYGIDVHENEVVEAYAVVPSFSCDIPL